ncbi:glycosyl hydrolase family 95 catalytic domain-containing protein [Cellulomonas taurus]|uniref:glycosyl hydrolase family 95 catalytic domain-containing protein n=1 Tax=Cellulomonas taurus TaxID=2729175 RepID=UPI00145D8D37|nr:glycoside hydrolase N-terminal domain-containing protein [Cellulomonas taurus]
MTTDRPGRELLYRRPSSGWLDGLPLGNGRTGAMVQASADRLHLSLNDVTAWSGGVGSATRRGAITAERAAAARAEAAALWDQGRIVAAERALAALQQDYVQAFMPFADLVLRIDGVDGPLTRRLRLRDGEHVVVAGGITQRTLVSAVDGILLHRLTADRPVEIDLSLGTRLGDPRVTASADGAVLTLALPADVAPGHEPTEPALRWRVPGVQPLTGALAVSWRHDGRLDDGQCDGPSHDGCPRLRFTGVRHLELRLATATDFDGIGRPPRGSATERATSVLAGAAALDADTLHGRHLADHRALMDRFRLDLGPATHAGCPAAPDPRPVCRDPRPGPDAPRSAPDPDARGRATDPGSAALDTDERVLAAHAHPDGPLTADPDLLALLVDYGRYLVIASSRPGGLPATLQGLWNADPRPPWSSAYTLNINTEMNLWAAGPTDLAFTADPVLDLVEALADRGADTARRLYGARGWVAHHNTDAWANTLPTAGDASWALWPMGGVWLVRQLDELRRLDAVDDAWCRRLWPVAVGATEFALDLLTERPDGSLATWPSTSPENTFATDAGPAALTRGTGMDRVLLHELAASVRGLADRLALTHPVLDELDVALPRVPGPRVAADGTVLEWDTDRPATEPRHRHLSHLMFAYPGAGPGEHAAAVAATLDQRGDDSTGWSVVWKAAVRARLGDGDRAGTLLALALRPAWDAERGPHAGGLYRNLLAAHPPFQIDGNLGLPAVVADLLASGVDGTVHLLPALPVALADAGAVGGLVVHPGIVVDLRWSQGRPTAVSLTARSDRSSGHRLVRWRDRRWLVQLTPGVRTSVPL